jgi:MerR family transcriptional regulator, light-induced transcriptional regulator
MPDLDTGMNNHPFDIESLAAEIDGRQMQRFPHLHAYSQLQNQKFIQDTIYELKFLASSLEVASPLLFLDYICFVHLVLESMGVPAANLRLKLEIIQEVLVEHLPAEAADQVIRTVQPAVACLESSPPAAPSYMPVQKPFDEYADRYLHLILAGRRREAVEYIIHSVEQGLLVQDVYLQIFAPCLKEVGVLWQTQQITTASEHYFTATTQLITSLFYPKIFNHNQKNRRLVAACLGDELHEFGMRMIADFFEMDGWDSYYVGANTPASALIQTLNEQNADVLALSVTILTHIPALKDAIRAVRASEACHSIKILVGGYPFLVDPDLWKKVGADGTASDAAQALALANQWFEPAGG